MKKNLETSEWVLAFSLIVLLASLFILSKLHTHRKLSLLATAQVHETESVEINILGEVAKPGVYPIEKGARLGDAIKKSRPKRFADLERINLDTPAAQSLTIEIPRLEEISISVKGAVIEPVELRLPAGSRISDLKGKIALSSNADRNFLKRKRLLKPKETVIIPAKQMQSSAAGGIDDLGAPKPGSASRTELAPEQGAKRAIDVPKDSQLTPALAEKSGDSV